MVELQSKFRNCCCFAMTAGVGGTAKEIDEQVAFYFQVAIRKSVMILSSSMIAQNVG